METSDVTEALERAAHRRRVQNAVIGAVLVLVAAAGASGLILAASALSEINATSDYLKECTTPSTDTEFHRCYEDGQRRTAEAIKTLIDAQEYQGRVQICVLSISPESRTPKNIAQCEVEAREQVEEP